ncbi:MAG TPA: hypothetical protein VMF88_10280 [Bacteroidota bacterium]|nr:hypothetical protein [Bacteroidota bacterium]
MLALLLFVASCIAGFSLLHFDKYSLYYFGDAASHIVKAREFTDSHPHEIPIIGTVWLPLPHFLLLPFAAIDGLFFSGIAGAFVGIPCLVGTGVVLFLLVRAITGSSAIAFLMSCLYGLNPNVVYISLTPMDEPTLIFFVTLSGYALFRWLENASPSWFLLSSFAVLLASLCRYEAWPLVGFVAVAGSLKAYSLRNNSEKKEAVRIAVMSAVSTAGIIIWSISHFIVYGNPFAFTYGTYSALSSVYRESSQHLPSNVIATFGRAILVIFGPALLLISAAACLPRQTRQLNRNILLLLTFFIIPAAFILAAALAGYVGIDEWWWNWRYVLTLGIFFAVAGGVGLAKIFGKVKSFPARSAVVILLCVVPVLQLARPSIGVAVYKDAAKCIDGTARDAMNIGEQLPGIYNNGPVGLVTNPSTIVRIQIASTLPLKQFRIIQPFAVQRISDTTFSEQYLVVQKNEKPESELLFPPRDGSPNTFFSNFQLRYENATFALLERRAELN